jgi:hypothetical protein
VPSHVTDRQHVEIMEVVAVVQAEVVIADVASADDCGAAVRNQQLVVHARVQPFHLRDHLSAAGEQVTSFPRVEETNFDVRLALEIGVNVFLADRHQVIHDQANVDAPARGEHRAFEDKSAGYIRVPEVGHDIDR